MDAGRAGGSIEPNRERWDDTEGKGERNEKQENKRREEEEKQAGRKAKRSSKLHQSSSKRETKSRGTTLETVLNSFKSSSSFDFDCSFTLPVHSLVVLGCTALLY